MKRHFLFALATFMSVACAQLEPALPEQEETSVESNDKIYVTIEDESTRVQLNSRLQTVWNRGDVIISLSPGGNAYWWIFNGNTGARNGQLTKSASGSFNDPGLDKHYAVYPDSAFKGYGTVGGLPALLTSLPEVQHYEAGSYGIGSNIMIGTSDDGTEYKFRNISAFLRINLTGSKKVAGISLKGNASETMAGIYYFLVTDINNYKWYQPSNTELYLNCGDGVQLNDDPTAFYFSVMPVTFNKGITVTVYFADGTQISKSTSRTIEMERNAILPMATIATDNSSWDMIEVEHTSDTFTSPVFSGGTSLTGYIYWGDGNQTSLYNATGTYVYWDDQPSHTVMIKTEGQNSVEFPSLKGVSEINFSNF